MDINALRKKRDKLAHQARAILTAAQEDDERDITTDEETEFDRIMDEVDSLDANIEREQRVRDAELAEAEADDGGGGDDGNRNPGDPVDEDEARSRAFNRYLATGMAGLNDDDMRALQVTPDEQGGFLVAPQQFIADLIKFVDDNVPLRPLATVQQLTEAESLGVPSLETDIDDHDWTTELATGTDDTGLTFGKREFRPHPLAKRIKVSNTLLRRSSMSPETIVRERLGYKYAVTTEKAYMTGNGASRPLGIFTASADGISTGRDKAIGAAGAIPLTTATSDQLIDAKYFLKEAYWRRARWMFHRDLVAILRKLKDGDGNYLWVPGLTGGRPDTIVDIPFVTSEFAPNTISATAYVGILADFSFYWIVDSLEFQIQRLVELYAEANQVGFIGRYEGDGMPVLEEAFVRLQVA